jgi:hypothetical protein
MLAAARKRSDLSLRQAAARAGVAHGTIGMLETARSGGHVLAVRDRSPPGGLERGHALGDQCRVAGQFIALDHGASSYRGLWLLAQ